MQQLIFGLVGLMIVADENKSNAQRLHQFNFCPAQYMHCSSLLESEPWLINLFDWRNNALVNQWCLENWSLSVVAENHFHQPYTSLVFLPCIELNKLLLTLGGVMYSQAMRQVVLKQPRKCLNNVFGIEEVKFLTQQGPMLIAQWPDGWQVPLPEILEERSLTADATFMGYQWFKVLLSTLPSSLLLRFQLKLDIELINREGNADWLSKEHHDLAYRLIKKIAKQVIPQCFHLLK